MAAVSRALPSGINVTCKRLGAGRQLPWHDHGKPTMCVVYGGAVEEEDERQVRHRRAGDLVFRPRPERHRNRVVGPSVHILCIELDGPAMDHLAGLGLPVADSIYGSSARALRLARLVQAGLGSEEPGADLELAGLSYELLATAVRQRTSELGGPPAWLERLRERLADELQTTPTLEALAHRTPVSAGQLSRLFREHFGVSVAGFLRQRRVDRATDLLSRTDLPITEVALECGFYDQSHLTNVFRQYTGATPAAFRRRARASFR